MSERILPLFVASESFFGLIREVYTNLPRLGRLLLAICCWLAIPGALAEAQVLDPKPPQVSVAFLDPPSPFTQDGTPHLLYEMLITNYSSASYVIESIDVQAGMMRFVFAGGRLGELVRVLGAPVTPLDSVAAIRAGQVGGTRLEAGRTALVYMRLDFQSTVQIPQSLHHTLHIIAPDSSHHLLGVDSLDVRARTPVSVAAPLRGSDWLAGANSSNDGADAYHRRTILLSNGRPWLAQRYAIDWMQYRILDGVGQTWQGPEDQNRSYFCYGKPIYSVAPGRVIEAVDGIPENVPHSGKYVVDLTYDTAAGNHLVVDIGQGRYVLYAHMIPGSVRAHLNQSVSTGQVLGRVGNSGSSTEPHLHFHIADRASFIFGNGVPYVFERFSASPPGELIYGEHDRVMIRKRGPLREFRNDYPPLEATVTFR